MRTSSPRRWICIRIPSSFHSTEARSKLVTASGTLAAVGGGIREDWTEDLEPHLAEPLLARGHRDLRRAGEITREHQRAACDLPGHTRGLRDRVGHQPGERALPQPARAEALHEVGLSLGGAAEELPEDPPALRRRAGPRHPLDIRDRPIELLDGERWLRCGGSLDVVDRGVADAPPPLPRDAGEEADRERDLAG